MGDGLLWFIHRLVLENYSSVQFSSVQPLSLVWLFAIPWAAACQASLSFTISQSFLRLVSFESMMPSNHLIIEIGEKQVQKFYSFLLEELPQFKVVGIKLNFWVRNKDTVVFYCQLCWNKTHIMIHSRERPKFISQLVYLAHWFSRFSIV